MCAKKITESAKVKVSKTWKPTAAGKLFTSSNEWALTVDSERFVLTYSTTTYEGNVLELEQLRALPGMVWSKVIFPFRNGKNISLTGLPNASAKALVFFVAAAIKGIRDTQRIELAIREFLSLIKPVLKWVNAVMAACNKQIETKGWLSKEFVAQVDSSKPTSLANVINIPEIRTYVETQSADVQAAVKFWEATHDEMADSFNTRHLATEMKISKTFFDQVERSPLTDEQIKAVVCFDNRVLLVASAGSGKTSTMVAKAGYALKQGYFEAHNILLLAFNNDATSELRGRIKARLGPLGLPADKIEAKTFHAFGLEIIGLATGKRPSLAPWVDNGRDIEALLEMVDDLKDKRPLFRMQWDMFRLVIVQDLPEFGKEQDAPDSWDSKNKRSGFWTLNNEVVKSQGELLIANWLFYNGVNYKYEAPYQFDTADATHKQYQPDFYFPEVDVYLEHWGLDKNREPPPEFTGYKESMVWKRNLHATRGTKLLETTTAELYSGKAFAYLEKELTQLGIVLDPNPEREVPGRKPIENPRLARTFRTFFTHVKNNRLTVAALRQRISSGAIGIFVYRHTIFLNLFEDIWHSWEERLRREQCIDFDDMLNMASDCIEDGRWMSPYELVMVDEFQDVSLARSRLVAALMNQPGRYLFAVGDDWQSINRFAGADHTVMADFEARFGQSLTLKLETTFRCPQSLCDISSDFIQKNPNQIRKKVRSNKPDIAEPVLILRVKNEYGIRAAVEKRIEEISASGQSQDKKISIYVLGRYNDEKAYMPVKFDHQRVDVEFVTVHSSKGLEADHVIIPKMTSDTLGFPSRVIDDPVLQLAMPSPEPFPYAEERRLFYVGLTRSRGTVTLITVGHKESSFVNELIKEHGIVSRGIDGAPSPWGVCPLCKEGSLIRKKGKFGSFEGCSRFPKCRHTQKANSIAN